MLLRRLCTHSFVSIGFFQSDDENFVVLDPKVRPADELASKTEDENTTVVASAADENKISNVAVAPIYAQVHKKTDSLKKTESSTVGKDSLSLFIGGSGAYDSPKLLGQEVNISKEEITTSESHVIEKKDGVGLQASATTSTYDVPKPLSPVFTTAQLSTATSSTCDMPKPIMSTTAEPKPLGQTASTQPTYDLPKPVSLSSGPGVSETGVSSQVSSSVTLSTTSGTSLFSTTSTQSSTPVSQQPLVTLSPPRFHVGLGDTITFGPYDHTQEVKIVTAKETPVVSAKETPKEKTKNLDECLEIDTCTNVSSEPKPRKSSKPDESTTVAEIHPEGGTAFYDGTDLSNPFYISEEDLRSDLLPTVPEESPRVTGIWGVGTIGRMLCVTSTRWCLLPDIVSMLLFGSSC